MAIMSTYSSELIAVSSIVSYDIYKTYINPQATGKQLMRVNYIGMVCFAVFMAVTSATSSELIAVSSIFTYDLYRTYFKPEASGKRLIYISHVIVVAYALFISTFSVGLWYAGISMGYLYVMMGVIISSAVLPASLTLLWADQSWAAATFAPILGFISSVTAWLVRTKIKYGELTVDTTGSNDPMLIGNAVALLAPIVFIPILTYLPPFKPQKYDWESMRNISRVDDKDIVEAAHMDLERIPGEGAHAPQDDAKEQEGLARSAKIARWLTIGLTLALLVLWPMPMFGTGYVFSEKVCSCSSPVPLLFNYPRGNKKRKIT